MIRSLEFIHNEWHHYLWDVEESKLPKAERSMKKCICLIQHELDGFSGFSTLDWLERA